MSKLAELKWKCRRGMKELDILFEYYLEKHYPKVDQETKAKFEALIHEQDPIISDYLFSRIPCPDKQTDNIISTMRSFIEKND